MAADVKNNPKSFYRYVRTKTKSKDRVGPLKDSAGNLIEDNNRMCDTLNNFFVSVFTHENTDTVPEVDSVFNDRLKRVKLHTLKNRRTRRGDMIEVYKIPDLDSRLSASRPRPRPSTTRPRSRAIVSGPRLNRS